MIDAEGTTPTVRAGLSNEVEATIAGWEHGLGLPPDCYRDAAVFELERSEIFDKEWLCVGRADQVPSPGDYFTLYVLDEPLIVVRDLDGVVRVLSAVCRHRGMIITEAWDGEWDEWRGDPADTSGNCSRAFRCPYHFWTYGLDGGLIGAPEMAKTAAFDRDSLNLVTFRSEVWEGFVFVCFDETARPLGERLAAVSALIADWSLSTMVTEEPSSLKNLPWNWKIMHENSIDVYHVDRLHYPRHAVLPSRGYLPIEIETEDSAVVAGHLATHRDFALSPIGKPLLPVIETLTEEERERSYIILVPPTLLIILNSDSAFYRIVRPRGAEAIDIHQTLMVPESYRQVPNFKDLVQIGASMHLRLNHQDYMVDASLQRATKSRVAARGPYSWQEGPVAEFDSWVARRYQAALARSSVGLPA
jgi:phenylpropionate dioxygenase-like ring-hydroxylating dioxygenase large terminal subunit